MKLSNMSKIGLVRKPTFVAESDEFDSSIAKEEPKHIIKMWRAENSGIRSTSITDLSAPITKNTIISMFNLNNNILLTQQCAIFALPDPTRNLYDCHHLQAPPNCFYFTRIARCGWVTFILSKHDKHFR